MSAECQLESIHRIHVLRAELEKSLLRANGGSNESETISQQRTDEKRPLNVLLRSGEAAQIQISGHPRAAFAVNKTDPTSSGEHPAAHHQILAPSSPTSRFTVSPTPNAIPAMTDERKQRTNGETPKPRPLRVLITRQSGEEEENAASTPIKSITVPMANLVTASSPASSIDSGVGGEVASPGIITNNNGNEFHLFGSPSSPSGFPSWATIPKAKRRIFNFFNTELSPVIDALALPTAKTDSQNGTPLKLQEPPSGKQHGFLFKSTPFLRENQQQQNNEGNNGYSSSTASSTSTISSSPPPTNNNVSNLAEQVNNKDNEPNKMPSPQRQNGQQREEDQPPMNGLPPRAGTIPPLKSILKKPKPAAEGAHSDLPRNHQRRMPTRIFLSRSISEVLPPPSSPSSFFGGSMADFNAAILGELTSSPSPPISHLDVFDEHLEQQCGEEFTAAQTKGNSSPSTCSTDTNENSDFGGSIVKKRVSFSEHVQARIYRSNSSILGQRRKNEKKSKQRSNRRCNSDEFEGGSSCEMDLGSEPGCKSSPPICRTRDPPSVFSSHPTNNSGFSVLAQ